jgi:hypothetical protein
MAQEKYYSYYNIDDFCDSWPGVENKPHKVVVFIIWQNSLQENEDLLEGIRNDYVFKYSWFEGDNDDIMVGHCCEDKNTLEMNKNKMIILLENNGFIFSDFTNVDINSLDIHDLENLLRENVVSNNVCDYFLK